MWDKAIAVAQTWADGPSCSTHDYDPCCHVRTGAGIVEALEASRTTDIKTER